MLSSIAESHILLYRHVCNVIGIMSLQQIAKAERDASINKSYAALAGSSVIPKSTQHRANSRRPWKVKAASQQYLTPQEEKALVDYLLQACRNRYLLLVKAICALAHIIIY
jgi:hypothetical protein